MEANRRVRVDDHFPIVVDSDDAAACLHADLTFGQRFSCQRGMCAGTEYIQPLGEHQHLIGLEKIEDRIGGQRGIRHH